MLEIVLWSFWKFQRELTTRKVDLTIYGPCHCYMGEQFRVRRIWDVRLKLDFPLPFRKKQIDDEAILRM
jgi:hypothetical protein